MKTKIVYDIYRVIGENGIYTTHIIDTFDNMVDTRNFCSESSTYEVSYTWREREVSVDTE
jgi:hypothetical protein